MAHGQTRTEIYNGNRNESFWERRPHPPTAGTISWGGGDVMFVTIKKTLCTVGEQRCPQGTRASPAQGTSLLSWWRYAGAIGSTVRPMSDW